MSWSDLPNDILDAIAKLGDSSYDVIRSRGVCSSWRSAIAPPRKLVPIELPFPNEDINNRDQHFSISTRTICLIRPVDQAAFESNHSPSYRKFEIQNGWIVAVEETKPGFVWVLDPFGGGIQQPHPPRIYEDEGLNLLDFRISEWSKYLTCQSNSPFTKIVLSSKPVSDSNNYAVLAIDAHRSVNYMKLGDTRWSLMSDFQADDVADHDGKFYIVDHKKGKVMALTYSLQIIDSFQFPICELPISENSKCCLHFVFSSGNLFIIHYHYQCNNHLRYYAPNTPSEFSVYKLDDNDKEFKKAKNLANKAFVLQHQENCCFPISVEEFNGFKSDCVYFVDRSPDSFFCPWRRSSETGIIIRSRPHRPKTPKTCCDNSYRYRVPSYLLKFGFHVYNVKDDNCSLEQV
ncbi:hypothetical protein ACFE04_012025 [Oxalis oulophora]